MVKSRIQIICDLNIMMLCYYYIFLFTSTRRLAYYSIIYDVNKLNTNALYIGDI